MRPLVLALALLALGGSIWTVPRLGFDLIPTFSQGEFSFLVELPEGTPLEVTDRFVADVESVLDGDERVATLSSIVGGSGLALTSTGTEGENTARLQVKMAEGTNGLDEERVAALLRERLAASGSARFKFERPSVFTFRTPVEVEIYSDNLEDLHAASDTLLARVAEVDGVVDLKTSAELGKRVNQLAKVSAMSG